MRCDQCRFWQRPQYPAWEDDDVGFRTCERIIARWVIADDASSGLEWDSDPEGKYIRARREALLASKAYVTDGSQYHAALITAPDFGCALFEAGAST